MQSVFYVTNKIKDSEDIKVIIKETETLAVDLIDAVHMTLMRSPELSQDDLLALRSRLMQLESRLRILCSSSLIERELLNVFIAEIDSVLRNLTAYQTSVPVPLFEEGEPEAILRKQSNTNTTREERSAPLPKEREVREVEHLPNRRGRILQVIREKENVSIKDISEIIKDCSEKTIQRELNSMIDDGVVLKKGDRRWSRYSIPVL